MIDTTWPVRAALAIACDIGDRAPDTIRIVVLVITSIVLTS
jgi:hypothetical protein